MARLEARALTQFPVFSLVINAASAVDTSDLIVVPENGGGCEPANNRRPSPRRQGCVGWGGVGGGGREV